MRDIGPFQATLKQVQTVAPDASCKNRDYAVTMFGPRLNGEQNSMHYA